MTKQNKEHETVKLNRGGNMNRNRSERSNKETTSPTSHFRFRKVGVAALIALAAVMMCGILLAEAQDKTVKSYTFTGTRNTRYGEILVVKPTGIEVYNTTGMNDCPAQLWNAMDVEKLAKELGAVKVEKNGPHFWMMDSMTGSFGETVSFGGIEARWVESIPLAVAEKAPQGAEPYKVFTGRKTQKMVYSKGKPVYEIIDPAGNVYVMQAHDEQFPIQSLAKLGEQLKMPQGWQYRTQDLTEDLILDLKADQPTYVVGDVFHQYYTRIPKTK